MSWFPWIYLHARVHQVLQGGENARVALGHHVPVLIPEIPDVPQQIQRLRLFRRNAFQEGRETGLPVRRTGDLEAEVDVGDEV